MSLPSFSMGLNRLSKMMLLGSCTRIRVSEKQGVFAKARYSALRFELKEVPYSSFYMVAFTYLDIVLYVLHENPLVFVRVVLHLLQHCFF